MQPDFSQIGPLLLAALVVFGVYRRFRRTFGRQVLNRARMIARIAVLAVIGCTFLPLALRSGQFLAAEIAGVAVGLGLGLWGAERTRFLMHGDRLHYLPHTQTGIAVSLLFLGRLVFRFVQMYTGAPSPQAASAYAGNGAASMLRSPLTVGIFFVLVGYYVCYYSLVLWKSKHLKPEDIESAPAPASAAPVP